ncbi:MAG: tol-pal system protein YbgF [Geobacteraceae bacterium]
MRLHVWLGLCFVSFAASGCSNNDVIMKKQMELEARFEQLVQGNVSSNARLTEIDNELKALQAQTKATTTDVEQMKPAYQELKTSVELLAQKAPVETAPAPPAPRIELVNKDAVPDGKDAGHQDAYMKAFGLFSSNNYPLAVDAFESFIKSYPGSEFAGNAQYWIGECHYTQHNYVKAIEAFNRVVKNYPNGNKVSDAMLKIGFSYISMNEMSKAKTELQSLIEKYPRSPAAAKARERLSRN